MKIGLLGKKVGMTRVFSEDGIAVAVTVINVEPSVVTQIKTKAKDGYVALQLGAYDAREKKVVKSRKKLFEKINSTCKKHLYEIRFEDEVKGLDCGDVLGIDNFDVGDMVDVSGVSIGKGFQGVVKRHHFHGGKGSHGDKTGRRTGSIGQSAYPARVFKGMKGPGRMGNENVTMQNLEVFSVDVENNVLLIKGSVPGHVNNTVLISISLKEGIEKELKIKKAISDAEAKHSDANKEIEIKEEIVESGSEQLEEASADIEAVKEEAKKENNGKEKK